MTKILPMTKILLASSAGYLLLVTVLAPTAPRLETPAAPSGAEIAGARILEAARAFAGTLRADQAEKALASLDDPARSDWHFVPRRRPGLALADLDAAQREALWRLLDASLGEAGRRRAREVIELEGILREIEGPGGSIVRDPGLYHLRFWGKPSATERWAWRFEGHHLSLHYTLDGRRLESATPSFFGANPAEVKDGPRKGLRVLAQVEDAGRALVTALDPDQLATCLDETVPDEVQEAGKPRYEGVFPAGIQLSVLSPAQRDTFGKLVRAYTENLPLEFAREVEREIDGEDPREVHFAWRGSLEAREPHSYMAHGKTFVISYANVQGGGTHVHSALRQRGRDFGGRKA